MIKKPGWIRNKLRSLMYLIFNTLDNNNNIVFSKNGEKRFIDALFDHLNKSIRGQKVLFDIGANIGEYSLLLLDKSRQSSDTRIHIFEPTQSCFEALSKKFQASGTVILNRKAVSDSAGKATIYYDSRGSALASLYKRNLASFSVDLNLSEVVETVRLDEYIEERRIDHIHFLKIDIEGHEVAAFRGMGKYFSADFVDFIQFEYGGANLDAHTSLMDLYMLFEQAGFKIAKIMPNGLEVRTYSPWMDNFQYANYVALSKRFVHNLR